VAVEVDQDKEALHHLQRMVVMVDQEVEKNMVELPVQETHLQ
jgi:hypothetical protein